MPTDIETSNPAFEALFSLIETKKHVEFSSELTKYLGSGGDINAKNKRGFPLLVFAVANHNNEATRLILDNHADANAKYELNCETPNGGYTALYCATRDDARAILLSLLANDKLDTNLPSLGGQYPLHTAALDGQTKLVEALLKRGARIDQLDGAQRTPLLCAASKYQFAVIEYLLTKGAALENTLKNPDTKHTVRLFIYTKLKKSNKLIPEPNTPYNDEIAEEIRLHNLIVGEQLKKSREIKI